MMLDLDVDIDASKVVAELDSAIRWLDRPHRIAFLRRTGVKMMRSIQMNFNAEGRPEKWAPLAESTIERRPLAQRGKPKILQKTGRLKNSIAYDIDPSGDFVEIGTNVEYAPALQKGEHPVVRMAERPFILFQEIDIARITRDAERAFAF